MSRMFVALFLAAIVAAFAGCNQGQSTGGSTGRKDDPVTGRAEGTRTEKQSEKAKQADSIEKPDVTTTAGQLADDYAADRKAADEKYHRKLVRFTGEVEAVTKDDAGVMVVKVKGNKKLYISCGIPGWSQAKARTLTPGQAINIQGNCSGVAGDSVSVSTCDFVE